MRIVKSILRNRSKYGNETKSSTRVEDFVFFRISDIQSLWSYQQFSHYDNSPKSLKALSNNQERCIK